MKKASSGKLLKKLTNKYRLVVLNDTTFEEKASFRLSRFNVYFIVSTSVLIIVGIIFLLLILTPLKEYIPGYGDVQLRSDLIELKVHADSLSKVVDNQDRWIYNIRSVLEGKMDSVTQYNEGTGANYDTIDLNKIPLEDALLREEMEQEENYALMFSSKADQNKVKLSNLNLFPPVKGYITSAFNVDEDHYGVDIVAQEKEPIKVIMDGIVIFSSWTLETGYVIAVLHKYNVVSFYKHNSVLLKKVGNFVKAGDAVAIIGSSGELTTGPHLHFELWHNGAAVNPEMYIAF